MISKVVVIADALVRLCPSQLLIFVEIVARGLPFGEIIEAREDCTPPNTSWLSNPSPLKKKSIKEAKDHISEF